MNTTVIAGGMGTRISDKSVLQPKPIIEIGGRPILWHVIKVFARHGLKDFVVGFGGSGYIIKEYWPFMSELTIDDVGNKIAYHQNVIEPRRVTLVDKGGKTLTGGRLKRVVRYLDPWEPFSFTYGDGVAGIDLGALINHHHHHRKAATLTAVVPPGRYGAFDLNSDDGIARFTEKAPGGNASHQRRLLCPQADGNRNDGRRRDLLGDRAARRTGAGRPAASRLLACHGHVARQITSGGTLLVGSGTVEGSVVMMRHFALGLRDCTGDCRITLEPAVRRSQERGPSALPRRSGVATHQVQAGSQR